MKAKFTHIYYLAVQNRICMLRKCIFTLTLFTVPLLILIGCSSNSSIKKVSSATGWKIGEEGGFDYKGKDYKDQIQGPNLILIHGGTYTKGRVQDDVMKDWNNAPTRMQVRSFYMDETEVTNLMYIEYLNWLKRVFVQEDGTNPIYISALPDTLVWRNQLGFYDDMVNNYLRHPAFRTHPVVGVSWQQASNFAKWRTDRVNEIILEEKVGLLKEPELLMILRALQTLTLKHTLSAQTRFMEKNTMLIMLKKLKVTPKMKLNYLLVKVLKLKLKEKEMSLTILKLPTQVLNMELFYLNIGYQQKLNGNMQHLGLLGFVNTIHIKERRNIHGLVIPLE